MKHFIGFFTSRIHADHHFIQTAFYDLFDNGFGKLCSVCRNVDPFVGIDGFKMAHCRKQIRIQQRFILKHQADLV